MARFGRTKLMAVAIKRFLTQVRRHAPELYAPLPEELRLRYEPAQAQLFAHATDAETRQRCRQQAAEDLLWVIEHFADMHQLNGCSTYKVLRTIFDQQCELVADKVIIRDKTGGDRIQNPSDPDATYDGHKGPGYQVQITETCSPSNEVQLITASLPQTACEGDEAAVVPMLDQLKDADLLPEEMLADAIYGGDDNVQAAAERGVELIAPVPGRTPEVDPEARAWMTSLSTSEPAWSMPALRGMSHCPARAMRRLARPELRCQQRFAVDVRSGTDVRSARLARAALPSSSRTTITAWPVGDLSRRPTFSSSGILCDRGSSRPTAG